MDALRVQSKFLIVAPDRCLHPGQLVIRHGRVVEVSGRLDQRADIDLGDAALLPGLINAHTHLEFSSLQTPFAAGENFPQWISQVVAYRRNLSEPQTAVANEGQPKHLRTALTAGLRESFQSGSVVVGDIVTPPWHAGLLPSPDELASGLPMRNCGWRVGDVSSTSWHEHLGPVSYPRVIVIAELLGLSAQQCNASWQWAMESISQLKGEMFTGCGLSPHAPYSIHFPTVQTLLGRSVPTAIVAMHLAESREELEWIGAGKGPFREVFDRLGIIPTAAPPTVDQCIELLSCCQQGLLIHGNYLTATQIGQVAAAPGITIVFCPRTHAHFGHDRYPLELMRAAGARIALGTDSRASNPDLNLWDELALVKRHYPQLPGSELLHWVTTAPARALGVAHNFGSLSPGQLAAACVARAQPHWNVNNLLDEMCQLSASELELAPLPIKLGLIAH